MAAPIPHLGLGLPAMQLPLSGRDRDSHGYMDTTTPLQFHPAAHARRDAFLAFSSLVAHSLKWQQGTSGRNKKPAHTAQVDHSC
jgi:hypothetical protein